MFCLGAYPVVESVWFIVPVPSDSGNQQKALNTLSLSHSQPSFNTFTTVLDSSLKLTAELDILGVVNGLRQSLAVVSLACCVGSFPAAGDTILGKRHDDAAAAGPFSRGPAIAKGADTLPKSTMSHERSTPSSSGPSEYANPSPSFARSAPGFIRDRNAPITKLERFAMRRSDSSFNAIAGAAGGFASGVVSCPLDVIKTKLQAQGGFRARAGHPNVVGDVVYRGMLGTARIIWKEEGLRGMYRGLGPIILGYLPTWAVWFTVYGKSKEYFSRTNDNQLVVNFWSSIVAGASSTMVTNPIWVIKTRLMSQVSRQSTLSEARPPWNYTSTLDAARKMYATEGVLSFYSGLTPALLGLTHVAVQFPAYEYLKTKFTGQGMGLEGDLDNRSDWVGILSASVLSKIMASSATYPHEVIRTRLQTQQRSLPSASVEYTTFRGGLESSHGPTDIITKAAKVAIPRYKGIVMTFQTILREEGWRAFYAGMGTNMMRAVPAATTTMLTYEYVKKNLNRLKAEGYRKEGSMF